MVVRARQHVPSTQGHVGVYAKDSRRRQALARSLDAAGHSHREASTPRELHRLLQRQQFDVATLIVRDAQDADEIAVALEGTKLPHHTILLGSASGLPLALKRRHGGTFRFVPGRLRSQDITRLVDASISAGMWDEAAFGNGECSRLEPLDLEEIIERAAATISSEAKHKHQRFNVFVSGADGRVLGVRAKLRGMFSALLGLIVSLAPDRATVHVDAHAAREEWLISISAVQTRSAGRPTTADIASDLSDKRQALTAISRDVREQGGLLWVEVAGPSALAFCLTLPRPLEALAVSA